MFLSYSIEVPHQLKQIFPDSSKSPFSRYDGANDAFPHCMPSPSSIQRPRISSLTWPVIPGCCAPRLYGVCEYGSQGNAP